MKNFIHLFTPPVMSGNTFEKSHIHILQSDSLIFPMRFPNQPLYSWNIDLCLPFVNTFILLLGGVLQECGDFTWRVSDSERISGGYSQWMMGLVLVGYSLNVTSLS